MVGTPIRTEEEQVDMVLHLSMEKVGTKISLTEEEVLTKIKPHVMVTVKVAMGIGSCNTISNLKDLSLPTVLVHTDKPCLQLKDLMEDTRHRQEVDTATCMDWKRVPLLRLQFHQLLGRHRFPLDPQHHIPLVLPLPPQHHLPHLPLPLQHRIPLVLPLILQHRIPLVLPLPSQLLLPMLPTILLPTLTVEEVTVMVMVMVMEAVKEEATEE